METLFSFRAGSWAGRAYYTSAKDEPCFTGYLLLFVHLFFCSLVNRRKFVFFACRIVWELKRSYECRKCVITLPALTGCKAHSLQTKGMSGRIVWDACIGVNLNINTVYILLRYFLKEPCMSTGCGCNMCNSQDSRVLLRNVLTIISVRVSIGRGQTCTVPKKRGTVPTSYSLRRLAVYCGECQELAATEIAQFASAGRVDIKYAISIFQVSCPPPLTPNLIPSVWIPSLIP